MSNLRSRPAVALGLLAVVIFAIFGANLGCKGVQVARSTQAFPPDTGFVRREFFTDGKPQTLWVFLPKDYKPGVKFPAIVFLHGLFEAGDGTAALSGGLGPVIAEHPENWPFITIFPQSNGTWRGEARERLVIAALDFAQSQFSIDPDRVVLAGLSYGALGTWQIGAKHPDRFAALVPVSGHSATELVQRLVLLPVWAFDMRGDPIVKAQNSEQMVTEIKKRGGIARLTEFFGSEHDCWDQAVHESDLVEWMLKQRRRSLPPNIAASDSAVANVDQRE